MANTSQIETKTLTEGSTGGSELFTWLPRTGDRDIKKKPDDRGNEVLRAKCHCGGVSFTISRPTLPAIKNDPYLSKYISPRDTNKWLACLGPCQTCRLQCGKLVTAWTFVPRAHTRPPMPSGLVPFGTMKTFASSPGVLRGFCGACGATVVDSCGDRAPAPGQEVIDVSV